MNCIAPTLFIVKLFVGSRSKSLPPRLWCTHLARRFFMIEIPFFWPKPLAPTCAQVLGPGLSPRLPVERLMRPLMVVLLHPQSDRLTKLCDRLPVPSPDELDLQPLDKNVRPPRCPQEAAHRGRRMLDPPVVAKRLAVTARILRAMVRSQLQPPEGRQTRP